MHTESEAAKACFERGAKADAHKHSVASKALRQDMKRAHRRAAQCILEPQEWRTSGKLDLHGLFVREAEAAVREFLAAYKKGDSVEMIVTGHRAWVRRQASVKLESKRYLLKSSGKIFAKIEWKDLQGCAHCASSS